MLPIFRIGRRCAAATILGALAVGCSAAGTQAPPSAPVAAQAGAQRTLSENRAFANGFGHAEASRSSARGWLSPEARRKRKKTLFYWGNFDTSTITILSSSGKQEGQITTDLSNPERLFVDKHGDVYATNLGNDTITAYKAGQTSPFLTISSGVDTPTGLTVDAAGTVYCANVGNDTITVYPKGKTSPSLTIPTASSPEYLATDAKDNLYAQIGLGVVEFAPGSTSGKTLNLNVVSPGALEVDKSGNIIVVDDGVPSIDYIPAGQSNPSKKIAVTSGSPFSLSLSGNEKTLYVSVDSNTGPFIVQSVPYPSGSSLSNKFTPNVGDWPIAVSPDNVLGG